MLSTKDSVIFGRICRRVVQVIPSLEDTIGTLFGNDVIGKGHLMLMMQIGIDTSAILKPADYIKIVKPSVYISDFIDTQKGDWCA